MTSDFHFRSLHEEIGTLVTYYNRGGVNFISIRFDPEYVSETIDYVREIWNQYEPGREFDYFFLDEDFAARYAVEERLSELFGIFAGLAIVVACLGLFGLASFTAEQRTKEIGIRKVLGATGRNITYNLSREFILLVIVSNVVAWPVSFYVMNWHWLPNFPYRITPGIMLFVLAGVLSVVIALATVGYQSVKAACLNPADALKYE